MKSICHSGISGNKEWRNEDGSRHREDGPAVEYADGYKAWYLNGKYHREDGPAIEYAGGTKEWFINGKLHREDGPAVEYTNGYKGFYLDNILYKNEEDYYKELYKRGLISKAQLLVELI